MEGAVETPRPKRFAMTGIAGYIAPRHLQAIQAVGGELICVLDPHSSVGILDRYGFDQTEYYSEPERFARKLSKLQNRDEGIDYLSVCSPNYLHDAHCRMGLDNGADVICEKPVVIKPGNLSELTAHEARTGHRIWTVLQMRHHAETDRMRQAVAQGHHQVKLDYSTPRGKWYQYTWKGDPERSGGLITNIGIHFLDLLMWVFGPCTEFTVNERWPDRVSGRLKIERANVEWRLSIGQGERQRSFEVNNAGYNYTTGFDDLHTAVYQEILAGRGFGVIDARPSVELAWAIQHAPLNQPTRPDSAIPSVTRI